MSVPKAKSGGTARGKTAARKKAGPAVTAEDGGADDGAVKSPRDEDALPGPEEIEALLRPVGAFAADPRFARPRGFLRRLASRPPQVLLLEGGTAAERLAAADYWAALLNCAARSGTLEYATGPPDGVPCLACPSCVRMVSHLHRDCFFLDGTTGTIKIDDVRALRPVLGEPPREAVARVVIFREAQALMEPAANALLKSLEEPRPGTSFLLLAPQRERLLPTLVSRGMTLTLPWPRTPATEDHDLIPWEAALCLFLQSGQGLFERTGVKGAVDAPLVHALINHCRRALARRLLGLRTGRPPEEGLERCFARLPEARLRMADEALAEAQDSLLFTVNPVLVLEWLATRLYLLGAVSK